MPRKGTAKERYVKLLAAYRSAFPTLTVQEQTILLAIENGKFTDASYENGKNTPKPRFSDSLREAVETWEEWTKSGLIKNV